MKTREPLGLHVQTLRLQPGDIAVLMTDERLSAQQANELVVRFKKEVGTDNRVLVLSWGLKLEILTRAEIEEMAK